MNNIKFIPVQIQKADDSVETRFINVSLILEVYQDNDNIMIQYTNGDIRIIQNQNIHLFMDRFK
jgi:hypothetical protein